MGITEKFKFYDFNGIPFNGEYGVDFKNGFAVKLNVKSEKFSDGRKTELKTPYFSVTIARLHKDKDRAKFTPTERSDRVSIFADEKGYVNLIEVTGIFESEFFVQKKEMTVDLPVANFDLKDKSFYFVYDGLTFAFYVDGEVANSNYVFGELTKDDDARIFYDDTLIEVKTSDKVSLINGFVKTQKICKSINYYSPRGYNEWAGDVVKFYRDGVYHLLFLSDRHHHGSRYGSGGHIMKHFVTTDFKEWEECDQIGEIDKQWQTLGTGTMFFHDGKYYLAHGYHTSRLIPEELTGSPLLRQNNNDGKAYASITFDELESRGLYPSGATCCVSEDGRTFKPTRKQIHVSENPSVYSLGDKLIMYAGYGEKGVFEANAVDGEWVRVAETAIPESNLYPSDECPSVFSLNGYKYMIIGGTGYFKTQRNRNVLIDEATDGYDVYDGLTYPMATVIGDGRIVLGGWLSGVGWGSVVVHRELFQDKDGRLLMRWLKELAVDKTLLKPVTTLQNRADIQKRKSYYVEANILPCGNGRVVMRFSGNTDCALVLDEEMGSKRTSTNLRFYNPHTLLLVTIPRVEEG